MRFLLAGSCCARRPQISKESALRIIAATARGKKKVMTRDFASRERTIRACFLLFFVPPQLQLLR